MRFDHAHDHLSRREILRIGAAGAAAIAVANLPSAAGAQENLSPSTHGGDEDGGEFTDEMFDVNQVLAGGFWVSPYGPNDQRGTLNEVTPAKTASALRRLHLHNPVNTYQLGEQMFNGFPAYPSDPPRLHDMNLLVSGFDAGDQFTANGGIQSGMVPFGPNRLAGMEERFDENFTFQIGSQLDGLNHVGIGTADGRDARFYNDTFASDIVTPTGTTELGNETMGPIVTRGVVIDIIGLKVAVGATEDYFMLGEVPILRDDYRITIDDIETALYRQRVSKPLGAGDVPILRTGWTHLVEADPARYLAQQPGIYLAEARWFADRRVAIVASDTWGLEVLNPEVTNGNVFPVHQELLGRTGTRIGESFVTDGPAADHAYDGVFIITPENAPGATAGSSAPAFLGQPGRAPRF